MDKEYPGQAAATSIGKTPSAMWSDPSVKEGDSDNSLSEALRYFIANPGTVGLPTHVSEAEKLVIFDSGPALSFEEVVLQFKKNTTEKDSSFFDGPVDLGKEHDGDFPSVTWMPRGQEDKDVSDADLTASKKTAGSLDTNLLTKAIESYVSENRYDIDWFESYGEKFVDYIRDAAYEEANKHLSDNVINNILEEMDADKWYEQFGEAEVENWVSTLEGITTEEDLAETYPQILDSYKKLKPQIQMNFNSSLEGLPEEHKSQIAAKYGIEYVSGLDHYNDAITNKHPQDRAIQYAVAELKKQNVTLDPTVLSAVVKTYSK